MSVEQEIREGKREDSKAIESLYQRAFPEEDLVPLVQDLLNDAQSTLSLVATVDKQIVGHVIFTTCGVAGHSDNVSLLAPLAVEPAWHEKALWAP